MYKSCGWQYEAAGRYLYTTDSLTLQVLDQDMAASATDPELYITDYLKGTYQIAGDQLTISTATDTLVFKKQID